MFGLAHPFDGGIAVRRRIPPVTMRHLQRMPPEMQLAHHEWQTTTVTLDELTPSDHLATAMLGLGDDTCVIEHHLIAVGIREQVAAEAADNAYRLSVA